VQRVATLPGYLGNRTLIHCRENVTMSDTSPSTAIVPFLGHGSAGADAWLRMHPSERRRLAMRAAREKDVGTLWSLTEAWLRTYSKAGATIATATVANHTHGVKKLLAAWTEEDLLKPDAEAANRYMRMMEPDDYGHWVQCSHWAICRDAVGLHWRKKESL